MNEESLVESYVLFTPTCRRNPEPGLWQTRLQMNGEPPRLTAPPGIGFLPSDVSVFVSVLGRKTAAKSTTPRKGETAHSPRVLLELVGEVRKRSGAGNGARTRDIHLGNSNREPKTKLDSSG